MDVVIWRDTCRGIDQGEAVAAWLTSFLGEQLRLVAFDGRRERVSSPQWTGATHAVTEFADAFALLAISEGSLADLNGRLTRALPMDRFRPNIVLAGIDAYDEDRIHELRLDGLCLRVVKPCMRCSITTTNQRDGGGRRRRTASHAQGVSLVQSTAWRCLWPESHRCRGRRPGAARRRATPNQLANLKPGTLI